MKLPGDLNALAQIPLESSHLASAGHDRKTNLMTIAFKDGSVYQYAGVPEPTYQRLVSEKSAGKFFNVAIKGRFKSALVKPPNPKPKPGA
jgi:hypothetical protein